MPNGREQNRQQYGHQQQRQERSGDNEIREIKKIFQVDNLENISAEKIVESANKMGKILKDIGLKTTQIRKFLDGVRRLDQSFEKGKNFNKNSVILLRPKLAYAAGRNKNTVGPLFEVLDPAIRAGSYSYQSFKNLLAFIEGIVAYHKFYGGKDY